VTTYAAINNPTTAKGGLSCEDLDDGLSAMTSIKVDDPKYLV
jgi:hypothetical protein